MTLPFALSKNIYDFHLPLAKKIDPLNASHKISPHNFPSRKVIR